MIDLKEAQRRVRELAADRPDYIYEPIPTQRSSQACVYFDADNCPSCIVGHALADELRAAGIDYGHPDNSLGIRMFPFELPGLVDSEAAEYLSDIQVAQDSGIPWGEAVDRADAALQFQL